MEPREMTLNGYQRDARGTQNGRLNPCERRMHALHGLASEVGEIHALYQKVFQGHPLNADRVVDELGDLLWFAAELADVLGVSLETVAALNIRKLRHRYPERFDAEHSLHREEE
jgi:NTP pyrophosphatase (non-canonical NTP hydrolase)